MPKKMSKKAVEHRARQIDAMERRAIREKFRRRRNSFFKSGTALGRDCDAKVYVLILRRGKFFTFKTTEQHGWPPGQEEIVTYPFQEAIRGANYRKSRNLDTQHKNTAAQFIDSLEEEENEGTGTNPSDSFPGISIPTLPQLGAWPSASTDATMD